MVPRPWRALMMSAMTEWADIIPIDEHAALCLAADESGSPLLPALVEGTTLERLHAALEELYRRSPERLADDVDRLLAVDAAATSARAR
jgi:hypothetical protein